MRHFPHETLPTQQLSLSEFVYEMQQASHTGDPMDFVNVGLCGRIMENQKAHRIMLNARQDLGHPKEPKFTRDFDSAIGITRNFPFTAALNVYPVPNFRETLKKSNHVNGPITHNVSTFYQWIVSLDLTNCLHSNRARNNMYHSTSSQTVVWAVWSIVTSPGSSSHVYTIQTPSESSAISNLHNSTTSVSGLQ